MNIKWLSKLSNSSTTSSLILETEIENINTFLKKLGIIYYKILSTLQYLQFKNKTCQMSLKHICKQKKLLDCNIYSVISVLCNDIILQNN